MGKLILLIVIAIAIGFWLIKRSAGKAQASGNKGQPTFLDVRVDDGQLSLESYVGMLNPFTRQPQPGEVPLGAPGMILAIPRKIAKQEHNALRKDLGLPIID